MRHILMSLTMLAVSAGSAAAQDAVWTVGGQIGVVSDYRDRGYTLSDGGAAVQGDVSVTHRSGFYAGAWASSIYDYGVGPDGDGARVELTFYAGWTGSVAGFDVDAGVWDNRYPDGTDVDYVEFPIQIGRSVGDVTLEVGAILAPAQTGLGDEENTYLWTRAEYAPTDWPVSLHATLGQEDGAFAPDGKTDWRVGLKAPVGAFTLGVDWVDSDTEDSALVGRLFWGF